MKYQNEWIKNGRKGTYYLNLFEREREKPTIKCYQSYCKAKEGGGVESSIIKTVLTPDKIADVFYGTTLEPVLLWIYKTFKIPAAVSLHDNSSVRDILGTGTELTFRYRKPPGTFRPDWI
jgi:hypothetical protein